jgi:hypothetical protein
VGRVPVFSAHDLLVLAAWVVIGPGVTWSPLPRHGQRADGDAGALDEVDEVAAQDVVEEPADALVEALRVGQFGIARPGSR